MEYHSLNQFSGNKRNNYDDSYGLESYLYDEFFDYEIHQNEQISLDFEVNKQQLTPNSNQDGGKLSLSGEKSQKFIEQNNIKYTEQSQNEHQNIEQDESINKNSYNILNIQKFVEYLNMKINKEKTKKITKDILFFLYKHLKFHVNFEPLTREEKRIKEKLIIKLYKHSNQIIECFESNPDVYLLPIVVFSARINNQRIIKAKRKKFFNKFFSK